MSLLLQLLTQPIPLEPTVLDFSGLYALEPSTQAKASKKRALETIYENEFAYAELNDHHRSTSLKVPLIFQYDQPQTYPSNQTQQTNLGNFFFLIKKNI